MRLLVCGTRTFDDAEFLFRALDNLAREHHIIVVIEGEAKGADLLSREWAEARGIPVEAYPADWARMRKSAGPQRNRQMLKEGKPDFVAAFLDIPRSESKGTANMIGQAERAKVHVEIYQQ